MKLTVLGSSHGVPEANRRCTCIMIEVSDRYYFIDIGMPIVDELVTRNIDIHKVKGIFITHIHGDHTDGLLQFADLVSWYYKDVETQILLPNISIAEIVKNWVKATANADCRAIMSEFKEGTIFNDGLVEVIAIPTMHCDKSYAFCLKAEGKTVLFTGDLKKPEIDFPQYALQNKTDLIVCEAAHFWANEYLPILSQCDTKKVIFNHYVNKNIHNIQELQKSISDKEIIIANDNLEVNI